MSNRFYTEYNKIAENKIEVHRGLWNCKCVYVYVCIYRVIQEKSAILWEMIVCVIVSKKVHMNMGPILNGYRDMVKRRYGPSCEHEQQLRNKQHHN